MLIETEQAFEELCRRIAGGPSFAIDMEFQRERTYFPRLCLIQIALPDGGPGELALVDPFKVQRLKRLYELVADAAIETIFHAGDQDMEIVYQASGMVPRNIFDTQIGAALVGYGDQPGYATLVDRIAGVRLKKLETVTDWSRRPLTPGQLEYALDDVRYLHDMRSRIGTRLAEFGRTEWAREEMCHFEDIANYERDRTMLFLRVARARSLNRRGLAILRELAAWREEEAMRRDEPRGRVVSDEILVEIARRAPARPSDLEILRGLHPMELKRSGTAMIEAVRQALGRPESEWPELPPIPADDPETSLAVDLLEVFMRARARESDIGPSYLGNRHDLADLFEQVRGRRPAGARTPQLLSGWRRQLVGEDLVAIASGRVNLHVDPDTGHVTTSNR